MIARYPALSRRRAREVIEKGQVRVDGTLVRAAGAAVSESAALDWDPNRKALPRARLSLPLLFADEHLVVVDKPAGLLSVPTPSGGEKEDTALGRVLEWARRRAGRRAYAQRVHRLDRGTSGTLAFALSPMARAGLIEQFRAHSVERVYRALIEGSPRTDSGVVDLPLSPAYVSGRRAVARPGEPSRPALTRWRVVERFARAALLEVELLTGRQHQVRIHLAQLGLPVAGDAVYGAPRRGLGVARPLLHAWRLGFLHPATGARVRVEAPLPADFSATLSRLRASVRT